MGVSSSAKVVIGFEVLHSDFWTDKTTTDDFLSCPEGHKGGVEGKHCAECGGKIGYQEHSETVPTDNFAKYVAALNEQRIKEGLNGNIEPNEIWESEYDDPEERVDPDYLDGYGLYCVDPINTADLDDKTLALGSEVMSVRGICSGGYGRENTDPMDERAISETMSEVMALANKLGIDRPPMLYLTTYCSY